MVVSSSPCWRELFATLSSVNGIYGYDTRRNDWLELDPPPHQPTTPTHRPLSFTLMAFYARKGSGTIKRSAYQNWKTMSWPQHVFYTLVPFFNYVVPSYMKKLIQHVRGYISSDACLLYPKLLARSNVSIYRGHFH